MLSTYVFRAHAAERVVDIDKTFCPKDAFCLIMILNIV